MPLIRRLLLATLPLLPTASPADSAPAPAAVAPSPASVTAEPPSPPASGRLLWELDPYYSSLALQQPLTDHPLPDGGNLSEAEVYRRLFRDSLRPRLLLLEASVYPLPAAGTWFKHHDPDRYRDFNTGTLGSNQLNLIDAVTAGFQEPWALSAFTGSAMRFTRPDEPEVGRNRGYMGYLVSWGAKHIHNNVLIDDNWWELEWKLKGERRFHDQDLDWSFRLGVKNHGNPGISDVAYVGLRRSDLDYDSPGSACWPTPMSSCSPSSTATADACCGRKSSLVASCRCRATTSPCRWMSASSTRTAASIPAASPTRRPTA